MRFTGPFTAPFYEGTGLSNDVPGLWDCAINGRPFMFATVSFYTGDSRHARESISLLKPQTDQSATVSESSLNPAEFARRFAESWHHGAGQTNHDRVGADPSDGYRFRSSKGVDVWTRDKVSLLNDTTNIRSSSNTNLSAYPVGGYLYVVDGPELYWTTDATATTVDWNSASIYNAEPAGPIVSSASVGTGVHSVAEDGYNVYAALGSNGVHVTARGAVTSVHYNDLQASSLAYVMGRLIAAETNSVYNITAAGAAPSALFTHPNADFRWVSFCEGPGAIYMAGFSGGRSLIYRVGIVTDATTLSAPVVAGALPNGEVIRCMIGYLGLLIVGTDNGVRVLSLNDAGNLIGAGKLIATDSPVYCLEAQDRFVWFGMSDYDSSSTGLGRLDLGVFPVDALTPAWASDLMATAQGDVVSAATFQERTLFVVSGSGLYCETATRVPSGTVDSGIITFGLPDPKVAMYLDARFEPLEGEVGLSISADDAGFVEVGTATAAGSTSLVASAGQVRASKFEVRLTLHRHATVTSLTPVVTRWTMEANPAPGRGETFSVPLSLFETVTLHNQSERKFDVAGAVRALLSIEALGRPVTYQDGEGTYTVFLDDHTEIIDAYNNDRTAFNRTFIAQLRRPRQRS